MTATLKHRAHVLCVDDEPQVLEGLALSLCREYDLVTAAGGDAALEILKRDGEIAVIVADMRMPGIDGAMLLAQAKEIVPDAVRMLLTGHGDLDSAIAAVNQGQIFRFLTKPCAPPVLLAAVAAAVEQHELITAQRVLLEQTLHGSVQMFTDVLALINPISFGRATRIKQLVSDLARRLEIRECWPVEVAAMLSQLATITLPPQTAEKLYYGRPLLPAEQAMVKRLPAVTEQLLGNIPRLDAVREILAAYSQLVHTRPEERTIPPNGHAMRDAQLLKAAIDFDALESVKGNTAAKAIATMCARRGAYGDGMLQALTAIRGCESAIAEVVALSVDDLRVGMVLAEDITLASGTLLVARGYTVTDRFLERVRNLARGALEGGRVRVRTPGWHEAAQTEVKYGSR